MTRWQRIARVCWVVAFLWLIGAALFVWAATSLPEGMAEIADRRMTISAMVGTAGFLFFAACAWVADGKD